MSEFTGMPCFVCLKPYDDSFVVCSACKYSTYCGPKCAKKHYKTHKHECPGKQVIRYFESPSTGRSVMAASDIKAGETVYMATALITADTTNCLPFSLETVAFTMQGTLGLYIMDRVNAGKMAHFAGQFAEDRFVRLDNNDNPRLEEMMSWIGVANANMYSRSHPRMGMDGDQLPTHVGIEVGGCFFNTSEVHNADGMLMFTGKGKKKRLVVQITAVVDIEAGEQIFLGYSLPDYFTCRCDLCETGVTCSSVADLVPKPAKMLHNIVASQQDPELFQMWISCTKKAIKEARSTLSRKQFKEWKTHMKPILSFLNL